MSDLLSFPWFSLAAFDSLRKPTEELLSAFYQYKQYLDGHLASVKATHKLPLMQLDADKTRLVTLSPSKEITPVYAPLIDALQMQPDYSVVFLQDYAPIDRFQCRQWLQKLQVPFNSMMYTYAHGNSFGSLRFIWKCGEEEVDHSQVNQAVIYVSKHLPVFTSRYTQKSFMNKYSHISKVSKSLLRNIFNWGPNSCTYRYDHYCVVIERLLFFRCTTNC